MMVQNRYLLFSDGSQMKVGFSMAKLGYKDNNMNWAFQESQGNWFQTPKMEKSKSFDVSSLDLGKFIKIRFVAE
jgi:hypothetical protein